MKIEILKCDDWIAVYKDGAKVESNHSCSLELGLEALEIPFTSVDLPVNDLGTLPDGSEPFPDKLPRYAGTDSSCGLT